MCVCVDGREGEKGKGGEGRGEEGRVLVITSSMFKVAEFFVDSLYWAILSSFAQVKLSFLIC